MLNTFKKKITLVKIENTIETIKEIIAIDSHIVKKNLWYRGNVRLLRRLVKEL